MAHEQLIKEIDKLMPEGKRFVKMGSSLGIIMPDNVHIDLNCAEYESTRNELEKYINDKIK